MNQSASSSSHMLPRRVVLRAGVTLELALLSVAAAWSFLRDFSFSWELTQRGLWAMAFTLLLFCTANLLLMRCRGTSGWRSEFVRFRQDVILPIVARLDATAALILAALSGVAEELFFRGALWAELARSGGPDIALIGTSCLFALAHFGQSAMKFPYVLALYVLFGLGFGALYISVQSLTVVMITHAVYNFFAFAVLTQGFNMRRSAVPH